MPLPRSAAEIFGAHADTVKYDIKKCLPATVTAVHPDRQTVDVQVAIINIVHDDNGNTYQEPPLSFSDIPLGVMRGGGMFVWLPVQAGDSVLLVYSDLSCDTWRAGDGSPQPPGFGGRHTHDSPFAIPLCAPDAKFFASPNADPTKIIIGPDRDTAQIHIGTGVIQLGHPAADAVGLASKIDAAVSTIVSAFNAHLHTGVQTGGGSSGPPATPISPAPGTVASSLVKCG